MNFNEKVDICYNFAEKSNLDDVLAFLKKVDYGIVVDGKKITDSDEIDNLMEDTTIFRSLTPAEVEKYKVGVCWDTVNYLKSKFPDFTEYYIEISDPNAFNPQRSHSFCLGKIDGNVVWVEASWSKYFGVHKYDSVSDALKDIAKKFVSSEGVKGKCKIYRFMTPGDKKVSVKEYIKKARSGTLVFEDEGK